MINILSLPNIFLENECNLPKNNILFKHYESENIVNKNKISLRTSLISFLVEGLKVIHYQDTIIQIDNTQFVLLKAGKCLMTEHLSTRRQYASILLFFDDFLIDEFILKNKYKFIKKAEEKAFMVLEKDGFVENYINSIRILMSTPKNISDAIKRVKFEEIMHYFTDKYGIEIINFFVNSHVPEPELLLKNIVENNINNKLSIEELAFLCNMSISTFKRKFMKVYQTSPTKWFWEKRLEQAANLLKINNERPSDIYMEVGFESLSAFTQSFKHKYGITPKQYQSVQN